MRDNFAKGLYPTLAQRATFANEACEHLEARIAEKPECAHCVVSFSFVNAELRQIFRDCFPHAEWILIDTSEALAAERIAERKGHFYKSPPTDKSEEANEQWAFAPVEFDHLR